MSLTSRSALSRIEKESRDLAGPVRAWLTALVAEPETHARFLNTLSLLEHIGSRKIMATQPEPQQDTLKHLAEETRHAFFFKRAAEKVAGRPLDYRLEHMLAGESARQYMARLDAQIAQSLPRTGSDQSAYLYMSLIVELRAIWFYRIYQDVLAERESTISLNSVLAEEELHLDAMLERLAATDADFEPRTYVFAAYENRRFRLLWDALSLSTASSAAA